MLDMPKNNDKKIYEESVSLHSDKKSIKLNQKELKEELDNVLKNVLKEQPSGKYGWRQK
jgi:hypothetical protein